MGHGKGIFYLAKFTTMVGCLCYVVGLVNLTLTYTFTQWYKYKSLNLGKGIWYSKSNFYHLLLPRRVNLGPGVTINRVLKIIFEFFKT